MVLFYKMHFLSITVSLIIISAIPFGEIYPQSTPQTRIVGGNDVKRSFWPWMAALVKRNSPALSSGFFCGGVLIHRQWLLTSAHCVYTYSPNEYTVALNVHDLKTDQGDIYQVRKHVIHPEFNNVNLDNDLALIQLKNATPYPVIESTLSPPIEEGASGIVIGWGQVSEYGNFATTMQQVSVPIVSNLRCQLSFQKDPNDVQISSNVICAGEPEGGKDACYGDSGGPIIIHYLNRWILAGIVSWGHGCARPDYYGVYTRVSKYVDFIEKNVPSITLTGQITFQSNAKNTYPVEAPCALIELLNTEYMTYTDRNGYYSFDVPSGIFLISITADNYLPVIREINLCQRKRIVYNERLLKIVHGDFNTDGTVSLSDIIFMLKKIINE
jgi:secreted trypsin-like serine protease